MSDNPLPSGWSKGETDEVTYVDSTDKMTVMMSYGVSDPFLLFFVEDIQDTRINQWMPTLWDLGGSVTNTMPSVIQGE